MLGFQPLAGTPLAAVNLDLPNSISVEAGVYSILGQDVNLKQAPRVHADVGAYIISGQAIDFILSISQASVNQFLLVGSTATKINGFKMIQNFAMVAGDDKTLVVSVKNSEGDAVNISAATIRWRCAKSLGKAAAITKTTADSSILITDGPNGVFTVTLDAEDTDALSGVFIHEAEVTFADGTVSTVLQGTMKVNKALIEAT